METPYSKHTFGDEVDRKLRSRIGWLTAGVASSIPWPLQDVCVEYSGNEFILRGTERGEDKSGSPCISVHCENNRKSIDETMSKVYRFTSILGWFLGGYVDVSGYIWGSGAIYYGDGGRNMYSSMGIAGAKSFNCNHMPVIKSDNVRQALAFWREGQRLHRVHDRYAFLSYYKVIESQYSNKKNSDKTKRIDWIKSKLNQLTDKAAQRVVELEKEVDDVGFHLYVSGRCAVAHASLGGEIVDPDLPEDRRRLSLDLVVMEELARIYIRDELEVPDEMALYKTRNRLKPWSSLLKEDELKALESGRNFDEKLSLDGQSVSVGMWPDGVIPGLEDMTLQVLEVNGGIVTIVLYNDRKTIQLVFNLDYNEGRVHCDLEVGGLDYQNETLSEQDVRNYWTYHYKVFCNGIAELVIANLEPIDCEVVIPTNMFMRGTVEQAVENEVLAYKKTWPSYSLELATGDHWILTANKLNDGYQGIATFDSGNGSLVKIYGYTSQSLHEAINLTSELIRRKFNTT